MKKSEKEAESEAQEKELTKNQPSKEVTAEQDKAMQEELKPKAKAKSEEKVEAVVAGPINPLTVDQLKKFRSVMYNLAQTVGKAGDIVRKNELMGAITTGQIGYKNIAGIKQEALLSAGWFSKAMSVIGEKNDYNEELFYIEDISELQHTNPVNEDLVEYDNLLQRGIHYRQTLQQITEAVNLSKNARDFVAINPEYNYCLYNATRHVENVRILLGWEFQNLKTDFL